MENSWSSSSNDKLETVSRTVYSLNQQGDLYGEFLE